MTNKELDLMTRVVKMEMDHGRSIRSLWKAVVAVAIIGTIVGIILGIHVIGDFYRFSDIAEKLK